MDPSVSSIDAVLSWLQCKGAHRGQQVFGVSLDAIHEPQDCAGSEQECQLLRAPETALPHLQLPCTCLKELLRRKADFSWEFGETENNALSDAG